MNRPIRVGTRGSALALAQTELTLKKLRQIHPDAKFETIVIKTKGDSIKSAADLRSAGKGLFVKEIELALLKKTIDIAIHSAKDLPGELRPELALGAVPEREDPSDLFIGRLIDAIEKLPPGAHVGTSSLRRQSFLKALYPSVVPVELRGNLDTRLQKLRDPKMKLSGIVVAAAGLRRLMPQANFPTQPLPRDTFVPAAGQGALAIEIRAKDAAMREFLMPIHHAPTATALAAERSLLRRLEGGCQVPLGVHAEASGDGLVRLTACLASLDGKTVIHETTTGTDDDVESLAAALEMVLKNHGAADLLFTLPGRGPARASRNGNGSHRRARAKTRRT
ncbi:MAG: hydroxymethylbilane synthase [Planctomycetes bacterium]|nr:hydroxymethylbilane synthase [Planctomycetota bacterium]